MNRNIESISPLELAVGDLVQAHGGILRIVKLNREWTDQRGGELVRNWGTELVEVLPGGYIAADAQVRGWMERGGYNIQGNHLARVARIVQVAA
jgi:hypothetical protein